MTVLITGLQMGPMLGAGHYGEVYLAEDPVHERIAAKINAVQISHATTICRVLSGVENATCCELARLSEQH